MKYSPVLIPTLNRFEHFKKCLESLERCTGAESTEVFVAVDYPPSEKYVEGWKNICNYLDQKLEQNVFFRLHVIKRPYNFGVLKLNGNLEVLVKEIKSKYDRYILSEDDNVFSPNFLVYINKGLDIFEKDPSVLYICGYTQPYEFKFGDNNHFFHNTDFSAWGYGTWSCKRDAAVNEMYNGLFPKTFSIKNYLKVRKHGLNRLQQYMSYVLQRYDENTYMLTDCVFTSYIIIKNMYVVNPAISKVRNIGWDIFGNSFKDHQNLLNKMKDISQRHMEQKIDANLDFEYQGDPSTYMEYNNMVTARCSEARISWLTYVQSLLVMLIRYYARKVCGIRTMDELKKFLK